MLKYIYIYIFFDFRAMKSWNENIEKKNELTLFIGIKC